MIFVRSEFCLQSLHCDLHKARISGWDDKLRKTRERTGLKTSHYKTEQEKAAGHYGGSGRMLILLIPSNLTAAQVCATVKVVSPRQSCRAA
jgi:hypothetical protein